MKLSGRVVIVTGAAQNNGLGIAERFAAEGAAVAIWDIKGEQAMTEAARLRGEGARAIGLACDVSDAAQVEAALTRTLTEFGAVDVLINNAGIGGLGSQGDLPADVTEDDFDRVMRVNVKSVFLCSKEVSKHMIAREAGGAIVNISSINAVMMSPGQLAYATSKGAIWSATKALAVALAPHGIRVNAIAPGSILNNNSAHQHTFPERRRMVLSRIPLGRLGTPADVAGVALFLAGDDAGYVTGEVLMLDGGRSCLNYMTEFPFDMEGSRAGLAGAHRP